MLSELSVNSQAEQMQHNAGVSNCTPQEDYTFGTAEHVEQHGGVDYQYQYGHVQTQQEQFHHTESSYSPASTVSPGKVSSSPNPSENSVITLPTVSLNTPGELAFGLDNKSQQVRILVSINPSFGMSCIHVSPLRPLGNRSSGTVPVISCY